MMMVLALLPAIAQTGKVPGMSGMTLGPSLTAGNLKCDSIVAMDHDGKPIDKIIQTYDSEENLTNKTRYLWNDVAGVWSPDSRYDYAYDEDANVVSTVFATWDTSSKDWKNNQKVECTFNENHKILTQDASEWVDGAWAPASRGRATYDANGYLASEYSMIYDRTSQKWLALTKNEYTSDEAGQWLLAISYTGKENSDEFVLAFRTTYTYAAVGKLTSRFMQDWDAVQGAWTDTSKETWTYDDAGNETVNLSMFRDFDTGQLRETARREYQYNERGNRVLSQFFNNDSENNWILQSKEEFTYNDLDSVAEKVSYNRDFISGQLAASQRYTYTYDEWGHRNLSVSYYRENDRWVNSMKDETLYDEAGRILSKRKYFWMSDNTPEGGAWNQSFKEDASYDSYGNQTSYESYSYDRMMGVWTGQTKSESRYDEFGNILEETSYQWIEEAEEFRKVGSIVYYYSAPSSVHTIGGPAVRVLVRDRILEVTGAEAAAVRVFDLHGKLVSAGSTTVAVSQQGCYLVVIAGKQTLKVLVN